MRRKSNRSHFTLKQVDKVIFRNETPVKRHAESNTVVACYRYPFDRLRRRLPIISCRVDLSPQSNARTIWLDLRKFLRRITRRTPRRSRVSRRPSEHTLSRASHVRAQAETTLQGQDEERQPPLHVRRRFQARGLFPYGRKTDESPADRVFDEVPNENSRLPALSPFYGKPRT